MDDPLKAVPKPRSIYETRTYIDDNGWIIHAQVKVVSHVDNMEIIFTGIGTINQTVQLQNGSTKTLSNKFEFPIEAETIQEAFEKYEDTGNRFVEKAQEAQPKILVPNDPKIIH